MRIEQPSEEQPVVNAVAILNKSAAKRFGWTPEEAIGQVIRDFQNSEFTMSIDREIVGVIPDIHFSSLHDEMKATVYAEPNPQYQRHISIKLAPGSYDAAISHFEEVWARLIPSDPVNWEFIDDRFDARYRAEAKQAQMFAVFSAFAIFVATLGLFGLGANSRCPSTGVQPNLLFTPRESRASKTSMVAATSRPADRQSWKTSWASRTSKWIISGSTTTASNLLLDEHFVKMK